MAESRNRVVPFGALKCNTLPSSLNMFTSSTPWIGCTFSFLRAPWSFLSSCVEEDLDFGTTFLRGVPFPPGAYQTDISKKQKFIGPTRDVKPRFRLVSTGKLLTNPNGLLHFGQFCSIHGNSCRGSEILGCLGSGLVKSYD